MHPILKIKNGLAVYLGSWAILSAILLIALPGNLRWDEALLVMGPLCLFYSLLCLTPWYVCRVMPLESTSAIRLAVNHVGAAILASALWVGLARIIGETLSLGDRLDDAILELIAVGVLLYLLSVALHYMFLAVEASRVAAIEARDAELRALKSQINPHFLFNCLNSISALTAVDPAKAREMCVRLSEFLRNTLGLGEREHVTWREELQLARNYLEVEQVRFGARLQVDMDVDHSCTDCQVPPLLLQPLVENAIKHGIATLVEGGTVSLISRLVGNQLEVSVENAFDPEAPPPRRSGLGLRNVRDRLYTRFGSSAQFATTSENNRFRVEMKFPCHRSES
ncbi:MAG: histidine kinase [Acidobacteriota bacterium]